MVLEFNCLCIKNEVGNSFSHFSITFLSYLESRMYTSGSSGEDDDDTMEGWGDLVKGGNL